MKEMYVCVFPGYRWCGPGCSGPGAPINDVDACCKRHDFCLKRGRSFCECDREMMKCLRNKKSLSTKKGRVAALMYIYFILQSLITCSVTR
ncbi:phospholipase [Salinibacillus xinjiangensis]|uniref:phospholipase n=1 Tax=Salinibacillus xinjiangensis TaxID=1229268 RepID=UPI001E447A02|nr:phospholipase [Salinibacillus xinjiangensis]